MHKPNPGNRDQNQATDILENKLWDQTKSSFMSAVMENCHTSPPHGLLKMHSNVNRTSKAVCLRKQSKERPEWFKRGERSWTYFFFSEAPCKKKKLWSKYLCSLSKSLVPRCPVLLFVNSPVYSPFVQMAKVPFRFFIATDSKPTAFSERVYPK